MNINGVNPIALAVFAFIALLTQVPVLLVQTMGMAPNMPIAALAIWLMYMNISTFINSVMFNSEDYTTWWSGHGWCDVDTHVTDASANGIMLVALTISCHLLYMSRPRAKKMRSSQLVMWHVFDVCVCFLIPLANIIVHPFTTYNRYSIVQGVGCHNLVSLNPAFIVFHVVLPLLISFLLLLINFLTLLQFFTRGRESVYQALAFKERYSINFFWRSIICCFAIIVTCIPLTAYNAAKNLKAAHIIEPVSWAHGKPSQWDTILAFPWADLFPFAQMNAVVIEANRILIIFISFVSFFCFGTGSAAVSFYTSVYNAITRKNPQVANEGNNAISPTVVGTPYSEFCKDEDEKINVHVSEYIPT